MNTVWLFSLLMLFVGPVVGIACATVAFTAYNIVAPLMMVGFGATVFDSVFTSLFMDFCCSTLTVILYSRSKYSPFRRFEYKIILYSTPVFIVAAVAGFFMAKSFLPNLRWLLKGSLPILSFLVGLSFFIKSYKQWKVYTKDSPSSGLDSEAQPGDGMDYVAPDADADGDIEENDDLKIEGHERLPTLKISWSVHIIGIFVITFLGSFTGFGGGFLFFLILCTAFDFKMLTGVAFGCYGMAILSGVTCLMYASFGLIDFADIWEEILISGGLGMCGAVFGAQYAMRATKIHVLSAVIGVTLSLGGALTLLLPYIAPPPAGA